eukprot:TRINITY_DN2503_c0_g2_i1.p1 TRINITY_DN2503_c0_g2~~TRINITY_DN2503_c0_g2_i1.p1  ORF type:complete len:807 (+),score=218.86 TRINITY_DN2503_c0_g2_i1:61-2421(+)
MCIRDSDGAGRKFQGSPFVGVPAELQSYLQRVPAEPTPVPSRQGKLLEFLRGPLLARVTAGEQHWMFQSIDLLILLVFASLIASDSSANERLLEVAGRSLTAEHLYIREIAQILFVRALTQCRRTLAPRSTKSTDRSSSFSSTTYTREWLLRYRFLRKEEADGTEYQPNEALGVYDLYDEVKLYVHSDASVSLPGFFTVEAMRKFLGYKEQELATSIETQSKGSSGAPARPGVADTMYRMLSPGARAKTGAGGGSTFDFQQLLSSFLPSSFLRNVAKVLRQRISTTTSSVSYQNKVYSNLKLFKASAQVYGPAVLPVLLQLVRELTAEVDATAKQSLATQILCGLLRGARAWPEAARLELFDVAFNTLLTVIEDNSRDTFNDVHFSLIYAFDHSDLRVYQPLVDRFADAFFKATNDQVRNRFITVLKSIFYLYGPRVLPLADHLLTYLTDVLPIDSKQITDFTHAILSAIRSVYNLPFNKATLTRLGIDHSIFGPDVLHTPRSIYVRSPVVERLLSKVVERLDPAVEPPAEEYRRAVRFASAFFYLMSVEPTSVLVYELYKPLIKRICLLNEENDERLDQETRGLLKDVQSIVPQIRVSSNPSLFVSDISTFLGELTRSSNWRDRQKAVGLLEILLHVNPVTFDHSWPLQHLSLLVDEHVFVRNDAFALYRHGTRLLTVKEKSALADALRKRADASREALDKASCAIALMALVLGVEYEYEAWSDAAISKALQLRKAHKLSTERAKDFAKEFWKTHKDMLNINRVQLEDETVESMRELAGNLTYFG